jgi:hypothetical protein
MSNRKLSPIWHDRKYAAHILSVLRFWVRNISSPYVELRLFGWLDLFCDMASRYSIYSFKLINFVSVLLKLLWWHYLSVPSIVNCGQVKGNKFSSNVFAKIKRRITQFLCAFATLGVPIKCAQSVHESIPSYTQTHTDMLISLSG